MCKAELERKLAPLHLTEQQIHIAFVSLVAQAMAPYGTSRSVKLADLLNDKAMSCDNYVMLTGYLSEMYLHRNVAIKYVGFDGGFVGNHAQLFAESAEGSLMLDPTIGLVAKISFDELLSGKPLGGSHFRIFRQHSDKNVDIFASKVSDALLQGKYRPSDLLYYFSSIKEYIAFSNEVGPLWKSDIAALVRRYPTPGVQALKKGLAGQQKSRKVI